MDGDNRQIVERMIGSVMTGVPVMNVVRSTFDVSEAVDKHAADELEMYIWNDYELYNSFQRTYMKNLVLKVARGQYDKNKAAKLMLYLVDTAAKKYTKEFDSPQQTSFGIFDKPTRMAVAKEIVIAAEDEIKRGDHESSLPKKYQGTLTYPIKKL